MMRALYCGVLLLGALSACGGEERAKDQWPISKQELLEKSSAGDAREVTYRRFCIGCHGADGKGNGGLTGADFTRADGPLVMRPDTELFASVRNGKRGVTSTMPAHSPVLSDAEIAAVITYVRERFIPKGAEPAPLKADGAPADEPAAAGVEPKPGP